jgi:hypothetical protein
MGDGRGGGRRGGRGGRGGAGVGKSLIQKLYMMLTCVV